MCAKTDKYKLRHHLFADAVQKYARRFSEMKGERGKYGESSSVVYSHFSGEEIDTSRKFSSYLGKGRRPSVNLYESLQFHDFPEEGPRVHRLLHAEREVANGGSDRPTT